jgi:tRNA(adenine34) deaminase
MPDERRWMSLALAQANTAFINGEVPVGCVVVFKNSVVGTGYNRMEQSGDPCAHAELLALKNALATIDRHELTESCVYVTVEPCVMCIGAMIVVRIPKIVYGAREPRTGACGSVLALPDEPALDHRIAVIGGVEEAECRDLMRRFFKTKR